MNTQSIDWPYLTFPPINLWSLPSASWFYLTPEEKLKEFLALKEEYSI